MMCLLPANLQGVLPAAWLQDYVNGTTLFVDGGMSLYPGFTDIELASRFIVQNRHHRIELEFDAGYPFVQVYAPPEGCFICVEPMTAPATSGERVEFVPGREIRVGFDPGPDALPTCLSADKPVFWEFEVSLDLPGFDFKETYLVPVYQMGLSFGFCG